VGAQGSGPKSPDRKHLLGGSVSFNNLRISRKLALAFFAIVAAIVAMSLAIFWNLAGVDRAQRAFALGAKIQEAVLAAEDRLARIENSYRGFLLSNDDFYLTRIEAHQDNFLAATKQLRELQAGDAETMAMIDKADAALVTYRKEIIDSGKIMAASPMSRLQAIEMVGRNGKADAYIVPIETTLQTIRAAAETRNRQLRETLEAANEVTKLALYIGVGVAILIAVGLGFLLSRMIVSPVVALTGVMGRLAAGDNTVDVPATGRKDEIGEMARAVLVFREAAIEKIRLEAETAEARAAAEQERKRNEAEKAREAEEDHVAISNLAAGLAALADGDLTFRISADFAAKTQKLKDDFNRTAQQLQDTMTTITGAIDGMRTGTGEISQAADDLSKRTEQQAASLEETAAALDQITATVKKTAEGAHQASEVTSQARAGAEKSGAVVRNAVAAMAQIEKSSQQIGQIIGVIDEIAFQTNLLALNAGVEAARAGDAGKGFAVVASEVRALAQRSAEAAKEIKTLISTSTQQVEQGVDLVGQTGSALEKIVAQVAEITGLVTEIAASAREQSTGLNEVNSAVNQMDQVTQQNAAMVEQSTAASHGLAREASELSALVARFRVGANEFGQSPRAEAAEASKKPQPKQAERAAPALKTVAAGGKAAALLAEQAEDDGWEEF
jgi:methyl-accepting chemotaxis protein